MSSSVADGVKELGRICTQGDKKSLCLGILYRSDQTAFSESFFIHLIHTPSSPVQYDNFIVIF